MTPQDLFTAINRSEPRNADLYYRLAKPFGRLAGSDVALLTVTSMLADRAVQLRPDNAAYVSAFWPAVRSPAAFVYGATVR